MASGFIILHNKPTFLYAFFIGRTARAEGKKAVFTIPIPTIIPNKLLVTKQVYRLYYHTVI